MPIIEEEDDNHYHHQQLQPPTESSSNLKYYHHETLPADIIVDILLKLPVESLLRCKSVCKLWFSLISDPHFVKSHLNISAHGRLIFGIGWKLIKTCCLNEVMMAAGNIINNNDLEVADYPLKRACQWVNVVGSCNGSLCLSVHVKNSDILFIWNPSIKKYHKLPSDGFPIGFGFGYAESTDDYKVVQVFSETVKMYSLRNGGWKDIGDFPYDTRFGSFGKFLNGSLHWAAYDGNRRAIVFLDLATETYGEVVMPPVYDEGVKEFRLRTIGEWLCVVCDYYDVRVDLWAMKGYGVKESWTKLVSVPYTPGPCIYNPLLAPLCISNDGKILFTFGKKLMIYDSNSSSFSDVQNFDEYVDASTFFESLVSPIPPAAALDS